MVDDPKSDDGDAACSLPMTEAHSEGMRAVARGIAAAMMVPDHCEHVSPLLLHDESTMVQWCKRCGAFREHPGAWQLPALARLMFAKRAKP